MFSRRLTRSIAIGATAIAIGGGAYGIVSATASTGSGATTTATSTPATSGQGVSGGGASNARSGPASGGAVGTVDSVSTSTFTISTSAGQKVTITKPSSTTYQNGTSSSSASAITKGESVLVLGTTSGTTITASQVIAQPTNGSATSSTGGVVPFQRGEASTSKQVGQIPANYSQGSGTIVSGTTANRATEAALASYPGGIVDRVVKLSNGEYEVHNIGVNWPHHIFVNQDFKVVGAD
jgi:membrane-bound inhibitor of C-type lysozyme